LLDKVIIPREWKNVRRVWRCIDLGPNYPKIYFLDTEFAYLGGGKCILFEIALVDASGTVVFQTIVNQEMSLREFYQSLGEGRHGEVLRQRASRFYGSQLVDEEGKEIRTPGKTINEIAQEFSQLVTANDYLVEWSVSWSDYYILSKVLSKAGVSAVLPTKDHWLRAIPVWKMVVPGFATFALSYAFQIFCPDIKFRGAHRADVDSIMLYHMVKLLMKYTK
jgi:hypothetical protein